MKQGQRESESDSRAASAKVGCRGLWGRKPTERQVCIGFLEFNKDVWCGRQRGTRGAGAAGSSKSTSSPPGDDGRVMVEFSLGYIRRDCVRVAASVLRGSSRPYL